MSSSNFRCIDILVSCWKSTIGLGLLSMYERKEIGLAPKMLEEVLVQKEKFLILIVNLKTF